jgi:hypothetical protein
VPAFGRRDGEGLAVKGFEFSFGIGADDGNGFPFSAVPVFAPVRVFEIDNFENGGMIFESGVVRVADSEAFFFGMQKRTA